MQKQDTHTPSSFHTIVRPSSGHGTRFDWSVLRCPVPQRNQSMMDVDVDSGGLLNDPQRGSSLCCKVHNHNRWSESARFELTSGSHYKT